MGPPAKATVDELSFKPRGQGNDALWMGMLEGLPQL